ncbi:MAG: toll/interleukin-1 receptor domain-containing protein [Chthoniobacterales bacterium]
MKIPTDPDFWEDLLVFIDAGKVIPVVGEGVVNFGANNQNLYAWLAKSLAEKLQVPADCLSPAPTLNEVVCRHLLRGGARNVIYTRLQRILRDECPEPGIALRELASISAFNFFVTTTFDPLLENALNAERYGGKPLTQRLAFFPEAALKDLPVRKAELSRATVYHLLGHVSPSPEYVVWEEDALEFICALHQHLPVMEKLARDLKEYGLLVIGLNFSDWLVRFFLRITKQSRLSASRANTEVLAIGPAAPGAESMVLFFGGVSRNIHVIECDPSEFVLELSRRWREKHPVTEAAGEFTPPPEAEMPAGAIFLSYAREDEEAARTLKAGLERHGCVVWYDRERLKPGGNWHNDLEDEVKGRCSLFLSVISRTTENSPAGYFHQERHWAAEWQAMFSEGEEFYVPVVIDDSPLATKREPRSFRKVHVTHLAGGDVTLEFGEHMRQLMEKRRAHSVQ